MAQKNHSDMVKFETADDNIFKATLHYLEATMNASQIRKQPNASFETATVDPSFTPDTSDTSEIGTETETNMEEKETDVQHGQGPRTSTEAGDEGSVILQQTISSAHNAAMEHELGHCGDGDGDDLRGEGLGVRGTTRAKVERPILAWIRIPTLHRKTWHQHILRDSRSWNAYFIISREH